MFQNRIKPREYIKTIKTLSKLKDAGRLGASKLLAQISKTLFYFYSSPRGDQDSLDYAPLVILVRQSQRYLSSFSRQELAFPQPSLTFSKKIEYPPLSLEDLDIN
jgi:hypothetical protein